MDELVGLGDFLHDFKDEGLAVASIGVEAGVRSSVVICGISQTRRASNCGTSLYLLAHQGAVRENSLLADAVGNEDLEEVVGDLVKLLDLLDVRADDGLLLLEDTDGSVDLDVHQSPKRGRV